MANSTRQPSYAEGQHRLDAPELAQRHVNLASCSGSAGSIPCCARLLTRSCAIRSRGSSPPDQLQTAPERGLEDSPRKSRCRMKKRSSTRSSRVSSSRCGSSGSRAGSSAAATRKTHGIVRGEFSVHENFRQKFRHGIYAQPQTYRAWVRFSGPGPYITPDIDDVGFMSISIKLMGVPGPKLMDEEKFTIDMFGVSHADLCHAGHEGERAVADGEPEERADLLLPEFPPAARRSI